MALGGVPTRMIEQLLIRGACRCQASLSRPPNTGSRRRSGSAQVSRANAHPFHDAPVCTGQPSTRSISTTSSGVWLKLAYAAWNWPSVSSRKCSRLIVTLNSAESGVSRPSNTTRIGSSPSRYAAMNRGIIHGGDAFANRNGFVPADAPRFQQLPDPSTRSRYSDEQLYALARYLYSLLPPPNPNRFDAVAARGRQLLERRLRDVSYAAARHE